MSKTILTTKLYIPPPRPSAVKRTRLIDQLRNGLHRKLTLVAAPAGFGKTTLMSEWLAKARYPVAWVSLDEQDNDPTRFMIYMLGALQKIQSHIGEEFNTVLQSPEPPPIESLLPTLLNDLMTIAEDFVLVLDDYHVIENQSIDTALTFLIDYLPPQMHLVIVSREDPPLQLSRLRARGQLTELRASDLRFTPDEASDFLNTVMGLNLSKEDIHALEMRTEGWIAGLQLAALSMQGQTDSQSFIKAFTGNNRYIVDYLVDEVLSHQPESIHKFLLQTSILDRLSGTLCNALTDQQNSENVLQTLERDNLFVIPLDDKRKWFRYHHLFADVLRAHLSRQHPEVVSMLHYRASVWFEENGFEIEAFQHATAGNDITRAESLIKSSNVPMYFRGAVRPVLNWLASLPVSTLDARPSLWIIYGWTLMIAHRNAEVEAKLRSAEAALSSVEPDEEKNDLIGSIATLRAMLAANHYDTDTIIEQSHRALEYLHPDNAYLRAVVLRSLAIAYQFRGERQAARDMYQQAIEMSEASGNLFVNILSTTGLGMIQLSDNELFQAEKSYQRVLDLVGDSKQPITCAAFFGLAKINYEWNNLEKAQEYGEHSVYLSKQIDVIDTSVSGEIFLAKLTLAQGDIDNAHTILTRAEQTIHQHHFIKQIPVLTATKIRLHLQEGNIVEAERLLKIHDLPLSKARICLAQDDAPTAIFILEKHRKKVEAAQWHDERLKILVLEALAHFQNDDTTEAIEIIADVLSIVAPHGFIRLFLDEGLPMLHLLHKAHSHGILTDYVTTLITKFSDDPLNEKSLTDSSQPLIEPLSDRELEVLQLIADGLSNREISEQLYLALSTVKGHNRNIYGKLGVQRRTEAVARARELGLM